MLIVTAKMNSKAGKRKEVLEAVQTIIRETRKESGCIYYTLYASTENENELMFYEIWEDKNALDSHVNTPHFAGFKEIEENYLTEKLDIAVYTVKKESM